MVEQWPHVAGYHILGVAGKGGMGRVYRAEQEETGRQVALKTLAPAAISDEALAQFAREAETIARLEHPHILPVYDFGQWQGVPFLAMRYLERGSVADLLRNGPIEVERAARWIGQIAEALDWAHGQGIVHKDVKPGNMLIDRGHNVYLTDFGIAAGVDTTTEAGEGSGGVGSAAYMAPEQARGEAVDGRADVYALAVSLFEMVTGQKPYPAETASAALVRHQRDPIPSARGINPAVPPALDELIAWGMAKSPDTRPATAADFASYLEQALAAPDRRLQQESEPPEPLDEMVVQRDDVAPTARPIAVGRGLVVGMGLILVVALAGMLLRPDRFSEQTTPAAPAVTTQLPAAPALALSSTPVGQLLADDFADPDSGFGVRSDADGSVAYEDGVLRFTTLRPGILLLSPSGQIEAEDVLVEVDVAFVSGLAGSLIGVICRWQDEHNYTALSFGDDGTAVIWQQRNDTTNVLRETVTPALVTAPGVRRHVEALCHGRRLGLVVDGLQAAEGIDPEPVAGDIGPMTLMRSEGELVADFDNVVVRFAGEIGD